VDSEPLHERALLHVCAELGAETHDLGGNRFRGIHMGDVWRALAPRFPAHLTQAEWNGHIIEVYIAEAHTLEPLPGALEVMDALHAAGMAQACVSNSERRIVDANLKALGIADLIDFSISFDDVSYGKPHPEPYRTAAERLGLPPSTVAAVEDSATGAASAREAGLRVFGILPEGGTLPDAELTVTDLADLLPHLSPAAAGARRAGG